MTDKWEVAISSEKCPYLYDSFSYDKKVCKLLTKIYKPVECDKEKCPIKVKCKPHDYEITPTGGKCKNCGYMWLYER